jgi:hypothetical protein
MNSDLKICILSSCNHIRTIAHLNHDYYAKKHGYLYVFDISPPESESFFCHSKIQKILKFLPNFDYVLWIDDDALFTDFEKSLNGFISSNEKADMIVSKSPIHRGRWTYFNAGVMLLRNSSNTCAFLERVLGADIQKVKSEWDHDKFGFFTNGDQDVMISLLQDDPIRIERLASDALNSRPYEYDDSLPLSQHFIVHFAESSKQQKIERFARRFQINAALVPEDYYQSIQPYFYSEKIFPPTFVKRFRTYIRMRIVRILNKKRSDHI